MAEICEVAMTRLSSGSPDNDVAVVDLGLRLVGGICEPADFWAGLIAARSEVGDLPRDRWSSYPAHGPAAVAAVNRAVSRAAYLENAADFDAEFFGVTPKEAVLMDPQRNRLRVDAAPFLIPARASTCRTNAARS
ncbi:epothilone polyketide synthase A [Lentzea xinjiangensis]|uniref:Epothilone polyketide synthase A n=1 Tax=Lentzea xinjiangensis TaxID=402600 RepID=A0A1H9WLU3_9PSEU|nr:beta-ketoacyl synthase N-terminal-like domain-containing protein [Lentzea xinjiangensis]SES34423.1 epothilone polyketide synthase A [Lentzea xinjiangensis]